MAEQQYTKKNAILLLAGQGAFFSLSSLPAQLATPFLGVFVEEVNRKHLLVACDLMLLPMGAEPFMAVLFGVTVLIWRWPCR